MICQRIAIILSLTTSLTRWVSSRVQALVRSSALTGQLSYLVQEDVVTVLVDHIFVPVSSKDKFRSPARSSFTVPQTNEDVLHSTLFVDSEGDKELVVTSDCCPDLCVDKGDQHLICDR